MKLIRKTGIALLAPILYAGLAWAQNAGTPSSTFPEPTAANAYNQKPHFGIIAGSIAPEGSGYTSTGVVGLDFGMQPYIPFGAGGEITYSRTPGTNQNADLERTQLLAKGSYNFGGDRTLIKHSYLGLGAGVMIENQNALLALVPMLGFDIPVTRLSENDITLGATARYSLVEGSTPDAFSLNGALKLWY